MISYKRRGFTLIELMIVLSIISILAVVLIPKIGVYKISAKNDGVSTNVFNVKAYLQTRSDGIKLYSSNYSDIGSAVSAIKQDITNDSVNIYGENIKNPFTDAALINFDNFISNSFNNSSDYTKNAIVFDDSIINIPSGTVNITDYLNNYINNLPSSTLMKGVVYVNLSACLLPDGSRNGYYLIYGIDNAGNKINSSILKIQNMNSDNSIDNALYANLNIIYDYLYKRVGSDVISANGNIAAMAQLLKNSIVFDFSPNGSNPLLNPMNTSWKQLGFIGSSNGIPTTPDSGQYSLILCTSPGASSYNFSYLRGTVIIFVNDGASSYEVYGIDANGSKIGEKTIKPGANNSNSSSYISTMLKLNLDTMANYLHQRVNSDYNFNSSYYWYSNGSAMYSTLLNYDTTLMNNWDFFSVLNVILNNNRGLQYYCTYNYIVNNPITNGKTFVYGSTPLSVGVSISSISAILYSQTDATDASSYTRSPFKTAKGSIVISALADGTGYKLYGIDENGNAVSDYDVNGNAIYGVRYIKIHLN